SDRHFFADLKVTAYLRVRIPIDFPTVLSLLNRNHRIGDLEDRPGHLVGLRSRGKSCAAERQTRCCQQTKSCLHIHSDRLVYSAAPLFKHFAANIWEGRAPSGPIIWDDRDIAPPHGLFTYGVGLTAGTSFFCEPGGTLEVIGAASSAAALSFARGPASI